MDSNKKFIETGFILLARQILNSNAWKISNSEQKLMMVYCILRANHQENPWWDGENLLVIQRGSFVTSRDKFASLTGFTVAKVRNFWRKMEKVGFLTKESTNDYTVITVCNYNHYQDMQQYMRPDYQPADNHEVSTNKECIKNGKESIISKTDPLEAVFNKIWSCYPKQHGRDVAFKHFLASIKKGKTAQEILRALCNYKMKIEKDDVRAKFIQNGSTWFGRWEEWVDYKPEIISEGRARTR